jgi:hypothetical protein
MLIRGFLIAVGLGVMIFGVATIVAVPDAAPAALWWVLLGGLLVVAVLLERQRYRSARAEKTNEPPGPGGGEAPDTPLEPRFQATPEVFVDPTTGRRMRVLLDPGTGERRYVAEP